MLSSIVFLISSDNSTGAGCTPFPEVAFPTFDPAGTTPSDLDVLTPPVVGATPRPDVNTSVPSPTVGVIDLVASVVPCAGAIPSSLSSLLIAF